MADETLEQGNEISSEIVDYVINFANSMQGHALYQGGFISPYLLNARMKDMNFNPMYAEEDKIVTALKSPKDSEIELQSYSQDLEITSQTYKRLLSYLGDLLSFDMTYTCINAKGSDYSSKPYQKDLDVLKSFCDRFDYKQEFLTAVREMLRNEAFFCSVRFDNEKVTLQELPSSPQYTLITGRSPYGLLFDLNMYFFVLPGVDINMFDPFFARSFRNLWGDGSDMRQYIPSSKIEERGASSWVYWQQIPVGAPPFGWAFKFNREQIARLPFFAGLMPDLALQTLMRTLQKNSNMIAAAKMVLGEVPMLKEAQAKLKDQFAISPKYLGEFLALVRAALGDAVRTAALPLNNVQGVEFKGETGLYESYNKNTLGMSGVNTNLIYTGENRINAIDSQLSAGVDEQLMFRLYPQFSDFMNFHVNRLTKNFKFKIQFEGSNHFTNRQQRFERAISLANMGIVLPQRIPAASGIDPFTFERELEEARVTGFTKNLTPIILAPQASADVQKNGRPEKSDSELSESGADTRSQGNNEEKKVK